MAEKIDYQSDWRARMRRRLYAKFRGKVTWTKWANMLGAAQQDLEDATQTLLTLLSIDDSEGVQLDVIGKIIGQPRLAVLDATYRLYLKARILANKSTGTVENIYSVMRALFGETSLPIYTPGWVKQFSVRISGAVLTRAQALVGVDFLHDSKEAGARGILEWEETDDTFRFWDAAYLTSPITAGVLITSISVNSTSGYPSSGYLTFAGEFDAGFFMNGATATTFTTTFGFTPLRSYPAGTPIGMLTSEVGVVDVGFDEGDFAGAVQA